jgi:hypothetical protein
MFASPRSPSAPRGAFATQPNSREASADNRAVATDQRYVQVRAGPFLHRASAAIGKIAAYDFNIEAGQREMPQLAFDGLTEPAAELMLLKGFCSG